MKRIKSIDIMILASFITTMAYSATYPYIHKQVMMVITEKMVAFVNIFSCISVMVMDRLWAAKGKELYRVYMLFCIAECLGTIFTTIFWIVTKNTIAYYLIDAIVFAIITRNIICGNRRLVVIRYSTKAERVKFENNDSTAQSAAVLIGSGISMLLGLPFWVMLVIATIGNCIDNLFYIKIYFDTGVKEIEDDKNEEE